MYPILFSIGSLSIYSHGVFIALGTFLGGLFIYRIANKKKFKTNILLDTIIYSVLFGIVGARVLYFIVYFDEFIDWYEVFLIWQGGLISFGGIIGGFVAAWYYLNKKNQIVLKWFDLAAPGFLLGWGIGRIGCFLNGDSYGVVSTFYNFIGGRIPTQLFESIWTLVAAFITFKIFKNKEKSGIADGLVFTAAMVLYSTGRFIIDFWRDEPMVIIGLKSGQIAAFLFAFLALGIGYIIIKSKIKIPREV